MANIATAVIGYIVFLVILILSVSFYIQQQKKQYKYPSSDKNAYAYINNSYYIYILATVLYTIIVPFLIFFVYENNIRDWSILLTGSVILICWTSITNAIMSTGTA